MANDETTRARADLLATMHALQQRLEASCKPLPSTAEKLHEQLRCILQRAIRAEVLMTPQYDLKNLLKLDPAEKSKKVHELGGTHGITGGPKDTKRLSEPSAPKERLVRYDEAIIHFTLTVKESSGPLEMIAYDFELYFPSREPIEFIRFDLNRPGHPNDDRALRSHLHPSHEDLQIPSAVLSPAEALSFLLYDLRWPVEKPRV